MNTAEILQISSAVVPDRVAAVDPDEEVTYAELQSRANRLANALAALGIGKGSNVGIMSVNSVKFVDLYYATAAVGATFVPLNFRAKQEELEYMVNAGDVEILFVSERYWPIYEAIKDNLPKVKHVVTLDFEQEGHYTHAGLREGAEDVPYFTDVDDNDPALVIYTSGTTSLPKGVVHTHRTLTAYVVNTQNPVDPTAEQQDVTLVSVPLFHIAGATTMLGSIWAGRKIAFLPAFNPTDWLDFVERHRVTHSFIVPTMLKRIIEVPDFKTKYDLSSLRLITYGAAPMPYEVVKQAVEELKDTQIGLMNAFGQTESASTISFLGPEDHKLDGTPEENELKIKRLRSVGRKMPDIDVGILDPEGNVLPQGATGEICIRGDRVMRGYQGRDEETAAAVHDGWLHTGDSGYIDEDGYIFITGRLKDLIIRGGENIAPGEIEQVLEDHPAIIEAAVIGIPDNEWGEVVKAVVIKDPNFKEPLPDHDELTTYVKSRLASYKAPASYEWVEDFPRNHLGKVLKNDLRKTYAPAEAV